MIVLTGPPGSGKSTYTQKHASLFDMIYDFDLIVKAITVGETKDDRPTWAYQLADYFRQYMMTYRLPPEFWLLWSMPKRYQKEYFHKEYGAKILLLDPGIDKCKQQIQQDKNRKNKRRWLDLIDKWYEEYEPYDKEVKA
jgi:hypothetical protein